MPANYCETTFELHSVWKILMYLQLCRNCVGITALSLNTLKITREFFQILNSSKSEFQIHNRLNDAFKTIALIRLYHFALHVIKVEHGGSRGKQGHSSSHGNTWKKDKGQVDRRTKIAQLYWCDEESVSNTFKCRWRASRIWLGIKMKLIWRFEKLLWGDPAHINSMSICQTCMNRYFHQRCEVHE